MRRRGLEQADTVQVRGQLLSDRQNDLAARYLILMGNAVGPFQSRVAIEQFLLQVGNCRHVLSDAVKVLRRRAQWPGRHA
jgi:hypothetical protein